MASLQGAGRPELVDESNACSASAMNKDSRGKKVCRNHLREGRSHGVRQTVLSSFNDPPVSTKQHNLFSTCNQFRNRISAEWNNAGSRRTPHVTRNFRCQGRTSAARPVQSPDVVVRPTLTASVPSGCTGVEYSIAFSSARKPRRAVRSPVGRD